MISCQRCRTLQLLVNFRVVDKLRITSTVPITKEQNMFSLSNWDSRRTVVGLTSLERSYSSYNASYPYSQEVTEDMDNNNRDLDHHSSLDDSELELGLEYNQIKSTKIPIDEITELFEAHTSVVVPSAKTVGGKKKKQTKPISPEELKEMEHAKALLQLQSLKNYLFMCFNNKFLWKILPTLKKYRKEINLLQDNEVFDVALRGASKTGNWGLIEEVRLLMAEEGIKPTLQSYTSMLACLAYKPSDEDSILLAKSLLSEIETRGWELSQIFDQCRFTFNEKEMTTTGICMARPEFVPQRTPKSQGYLNPLLDELNNLSTPSKNISPPIMNSEWFSWEEMTSMVGAQLESELTGIVQVQSIANEKSKDDKTDSERNALKTELLEQKWRAKVKSCIERDLALCKGRFLKSSTRSLDIYPYLVVLSTDEYVDILMSEIKRLTTQSAHYSAPVSFLCRELGNQVMKRWLVHYKKLSGVLGKVEQLYPQYCRALLDPKEDEQRLNPRQLWQKLVQADYQGPDVDCTILSWPLAVKQEVGQFLYNIILNDIKITILNKSMASKSEVPAFYVVYRNRDVQLVKQIKQHPLILQHFQGFSKNFLYFEASMLPMMSPPLPWYTHLNGGYLLYESPLIRSNLGDHQMHRIASSPYQQLYPLLDSLNYLGTVPWKINKPMLDLAIGLFNSDDGADLDIPKPPTTLTPPAPVKPNMTALQKAIVLEERKKYWRRRSEMYSLWCSALYRFSLANHFRDKIFWLPNNMDFRGRVYPSPPNLSHLSSDLARSLLVFGIGKPLGKDGFKWLKIHLINLTGLKKRDPVSERLAFAEEMMPEILDSARNPLTGNKWWTKSDEPWQTLAACKEVAAALELPDPHQYVCHLPIHQDGSCNGLQHYAALGRDKIGAISVNLTPSERPQDLYSNVAALVEKERAKDATNGVEVARLLEGLVKRKVIKQTVMTTVYGVTRYGARQQIAKQLKDIPQLTEEQAWEGASYLAEKTFFSLQEMFTSAKQIQDWFTDCAKYITIVLGQNVEWVTPLGLPVYQPYISNFPNSAHKSRNSTRPNVSKQRNAFPPNFVHSLDSSHMMLTSLFCQRASITFASVHDCFWTHASTVNIMNEVCREQFVALHSKPILEDLSKFLVKTYEQRLCDLNVGDTNDRNAELKKNYCLRSVPRNGSFELKEVLKSKYFFS